MAGVHCREIDHERKTQWETNGGSSHCYLLLPLCGSFVWSVKHWWVDGSTTEAVRVGSGSSKKTVCWVHHCELFTSCPQVSTVFHHCVGVLAFVCSCIFSPSRARSAVASHIANLIIHNIQAERSEKDTRDSKVGVYEQDSWVGAIALYHFLMGYVQPFKTLAQETMWGETELDLKLKVVRQRAKKG